MISLRSLTVSSSLRALSRSLAVLALAFSGCGKTDPAGTGETPKESAVSTATASAGAAESPAPPAAFTESDLPKEGSPEWYIGQLIVLRVAPLPEQKDEKLTEAQKKQYKDGVLRERNLELIDMAHKVITLTHSDKERERIFNKAVEFLIEARLAMAIAGGPEELKALQHDAADLYKRNPNSEAAAIAGFAIARLAHNAARVEGKSKPETIRQFAVQAKFFAEQFPHSESKAVTLLVSAAQSCELNGLQSDATTCYALLQEKFGQTPPGQRAAAVLRRLQLKGKRLELGGETPDGGFVKIDQFKGKPVLVVFWASDSEPFLKLLPELQRRIKTHEKSGLTVIGVCLDDDETALDGFVEQHGLTWQQIFYADQAKRGSENPVAAAYGVQSIPSLWLVGRDGVVVDTEVTPQSLDSQMRSLVAAGAGSDRE